MQVGRHRCKTIQLSVTDASPLIKKSFIFKTNFRGRNLRKKFARLFAFSLSLLSFFLSFFLFKWANHSLFSCLFSFFSNKFFTEKIVGFSWIRTGIVRVEGRSYKSSTIVNYDARVMPTVKLTTDVIYNRPK